MIKKIISLIIGATLSFTALCSASACHFHPNPPKSIVINGETYVTDFYDRDYLSSKAKVNDYDDPLFTKGSYDWYKILDTKYDLYACNMIHNADWFPVLYCKESEFEEVKAYYEDIDNYTYSFQHCAGLSAESWVNLPDDADKTKLEMIIQEIFSISDGDDPLKNKGYSTFSAAWTELGVLIEVNIRKNSKDNTLLRSDLTGDYNYIDGKLCFRYSNPGQPKQLPENFYVLDDEIHMYMLNLFEEYALEIILSNPTSSMNLDDMKERIY